MIGTEPSAAPRALLLLLAAVACGGVSRLPGVDGKACTEVGCENGVRVSFSFRERGEYVFEVVVDGESTICRATLPLPRDFFEPCNRRDVLLGLVGSQLPPEEQSIGGLILPAALDARSIAIRATRDGELIGEKTFAPSYTVTPGPNGPDCEPKECRLATATFP